MGWLWFVILLPALAAAAVVGVSFILAGLVFPAGGSRGPHDTPTSRVLGWVLVVLAEWLAASWVAYTVFFFPRRRQRCPRVGRGTVPLVLLPGMAENVVTLAPLRRRLQRSLGVPVVVLRPPPYHLELDRQARLVAVQLQQVLEESGAEQLDLLGHSLGGLLARQLVENDGWQDRIRCLVTVGTPHLGSALARLLPLRSLHQMRRGSAYLERLNSLPQQSQVTYIGVCSTHDNLVLPWNCSLSPRGDNFILRYQGHTTMLFSRELLRVVTRQLAGVETAGD